MARCKDCIHQIVHEYYEYDGESHRICYCSLHTTLGKDNEFCSDLETSGNEAKKKLVSIYGIKHKLVPYDSKVVVERRRAE